MTFRHLALLALLLTSLLSDAVPAQAQSDPRRAWLAAAFESLSDSHRRVVQEELDLAGLYTGGVDGRFGAGTEQALLKSVDFLAWNSNGHLRIPLASPADADRYLADLSQRVHSLWLYGEGEAG